MTPARITPDWIAVDWGTSNLRAWAMRGETVLGAVSSDRGMGKLSREEFEPALLALISDWLPAPVIACGMVGSRQGWVEARYRAVPCTPVDAGALVRVPVGDARLDVRIAPGLSQDRPADVMRGEETQIAGAGVEGVICLPGTHSKWVEVSAGEVVSFQTFMTGEMFALLSTQSVLRHGVGDGWDDVAFDQAISEALSRPEKIYARLFGLRADGLLHSLDPATARARLSGLLIGAELAGSKAYWLGQPVAIIGASTLARAYQRALAAQGVTARMLDATECTLRGLASLRQMELTR
jgi:2-dehydro-3-deoxygalactonokinase